MRPKYRLRIFYWNPSGTNDAEIIDTNTLTVVESLPESFFGITIDGEYQFKTDGPALRKCVAVSPVSDGSDALRVLNKYFGHKE